MSIAVSGHGAIIAIELDPDGAQGAFTAVAELNGDISEPELMLGVEETTPHNDTMDSYVPDGRVQRGTVSFDINYIYGNAGHTALRRKVLDREFFGMQILGPGGVAGGDEIICSGYITNFGVVNPVRSGARSASVTFQPSKAMKVAGTIEGQSA
jgi:hypothetical protein